MVTGIAEQAPAGGWQAYGVDVVLQDTVLHVGKGVVAQRLLQEQTNQWSLEGLVTKLTQGLQDPSDPQVVVLGPLKSTKAEHDSTIHYMNNKFIYLLLRYSKSTTER